MKITVNTNLDNESLIKINYNKLKVLNIAEIQDKILNSDNTIFDIIVEAEYEGTHCKITYPRCRKEIGINKDGNIYLEIRPLQTYNKSAPYYYEIELT